MRQVRKAFTKKQGVAARTSVLDDGQWTIFFWINVTNNISAFEW